MTTMTELSEYCDDLKSAIRALTETYVSNPDTRDWLIDLVTRDPRNTEKLEARIWSEPMENGYRASAGGAAVAAPLEDDEPARGDVHVLNGDGQ